MPKQKRPITDPLKAVAYIRVSTEDQTLGPIAQRTSIERWADAGHVTVVSWHSDLGISGGAEIDKRPALMAALRSIEAHRAGLLVVAKRDRLARDIVIAAACEQLAQGAGARVISADGAGNSDGPEGMFMRGLVDLFAQYERALIKSRTRAALAVKRARGERVGSLPIGYGVEPGSALLEADEEEQRALRLVAELHASGSSVRGIARQLNAQGLRPRGKQWHPTTIARVLARGTGT